MKISMALQKSRIVFSFQHHFCFDKKKGRTSPDQKDRKQRPSADAKKKQGFYHLLPRHFCLASTFSATWG